MRGGYIEEVVYIKGKKYRPTDASLGWFKEQNTLLRALWAFWSPEGKPTKPEAKCFAPILTWYPSQTNVI